MGDSSITQGGLHLNDYKHGEQHSMEQKIEARGLSPYSRTPRISKVSVTPGRVFCTKVALRRQLAAFWLARVWNVDPRV